MKIQIFLLYFEQNIPRLDVERGVGVPAELAERLLVVTLGPAVSPQQRHLAHWNQELWLAESDHVARLLASGWLRMITWLSESDALSL